MRLRKVHQVRIYIITKHNIYLFETDSAHSFAQDNEETQLPTKYVKHNLKSSKERFRLILKRRIISVFPLKLTYMSLPKCHLPLK